MTAGWVVGSRAPRGGPGPDWARSTSSTARPAARRSARRPAEQVAAGEGQLGEGDLDRAVQPHVHLDALAQQFQDPCQMGVERRVAQRGQIDIA